MKKIVLGFVVTTLTACVGTTHRYNDIMTIKVKDRAAFDLQCDKADITVQKIGISSFGATGCGKKASYVGITKHCTGYYDKQVEKYCEIASDSFSPDQKKAK